MWVGRAGRGPGAGTEWDPETRRKLGPAPWAGLQGRIDPVLVGTAEYLRWKGECAGRRPHNKLGGTASPPLVSWTLYKDSPLSNVLANP